MPAVELGGDGPFLFVRAGPLMLVFRGPHPVFELGAAQLERGLGPEAARPVGWASLRDRGTARGAWALDFEESPPPNVEAFEQPRLRLLRVPARGLVAVWIHTTPDRFVVLQRDGAAVATPEWSSADELRVALQTALARA